MGSTEHPAHESDSVVGNVAPPLGVAVVGLGIGEQHALAYVRAGCALKWAYDLDPGRSHQLVSTLGAGQIAESFEQIIDDPAVDLVSIASFDDAHCAQVVSALQAGKHVFVEKPLCRSMEELRTIERAWRASGRALASNLVLRAAPLYRWLKAEVAAGTFGRVYAFDGDYLYGRLEKITEGWRKDLPGYSVFSGGGVHMVDLMLWLTGERPATVFAAGNSICTEATAFSQRDFVGATFMFPSGLVGRVTANFGCVHRHQHVVRVFGTRASFVYDDAGARLHTSRGPADRPQRLDLAALPATKGDLLTAYVDSIRHGRPLSPAPQHEFDVIAACAATDAAADYGRCTEIDYV